MKTNIKKKHWPKKQLFIALSFLLITGSLLSFSPFTLAQSIQDQINSLNQQNANTSQQVAQLEGEASSLEDKINRLQDRINGLQTQINDNTTKMQQLEQAIIKTEEELNQQKELLGKNIRAMYIEGQISTFEMLASSNDLSDFVNKEQYRNSVKSKIIATLDRINNLKLQLKNQQEEVKTRLKEQQSLQDQLAAERNENNRILSLNESQRSSLDQQIKSNNTRIAELRRQQAEENCRRFGCTGTYTVGGGGYRWGNAPCLANGSIDGWCPGYEWGYNGSYNNWETGGYAYRNCTDWVAYRIGKVDGKYVPSGLGNANSWDNRASIYGISTGSEPRAGAAAVSNVGYYGHVMYVESVNANGSIVISEYNGNGMGKYSLKTISASGLVFVYF